MSETDPLRTFETSDLMTEGMDAQTMKALFSTLLLVAVQTADPTSEALKPPPLVHGYVWFDLGSAVPKRLRSEYDPIAYLGQRITPDKFVYVRGQTDTLGTAGTNEALSRMRARAVAAMLVEQGANAERITIFVCGERLLNRSTGDGVAEPLNRFVLFDWLDQPPQYALPGCLVEPYVP